jgi:hypothetical protein
MPNPLNWYPLDAEVADIGTADTKLFVVPVDGYLRRVQTVLGGAITGADDVITVAVDGTNLSPTITIPNAGSAAGSKTTTEYRAAVSKGSRVLLTNSGASTGVAKCAYSLTFSG